MSSTDAYDTADLLTLEQQLRQQPQAIPTPEQWGTLLWHLRDLTKRVARLEAAVKGHTHER